MGEQAVTELQVVEVRVDSSWHFIRGPKVTVELGLLVGTPGLRSAGCPLDAEVRRALLDWLQEGGEQ